MQNIEDGQYVCVVDVRVDYNLFSDEKELSKDENTNLCADGYNYSTTFQTCYLTSDYADPAED